MVVACYGLLWLVSLAVVRLAPRSTSTCQTDLEPGNCDCVMSALTPLC